MKRKAIQPIPISAKTEEEDQLIQLVQELYHVDMYVAFWRSFVYLLPKFTFIGIRIRV